MFKVDPLDASATCVQAYFNQRTNELSWQAPPSLAPLPPLPPLANEQGGAGVEGMSPEAEAAARAADVAAEAADAAKVEGHRLLLEKATRIEASLEAGELEAASLRDEVGRIKETLGLMEGRLAKIEATTEAGRRDLTLIRREIGAPSESP